MLLYLPFKSLIEYFVLAIVAKYRVYVVYLTKMEVLTYTSYNEHYDLHTEIHGSTAVNSCQIELAQKDIILLSSICVIFYKAGARTDAKNYRFINLVSRWVLIQLMILMQKSR